MLTKGGIAYNLQQSVYISTHYGISLHFSSPVYRSKFREQLAGYCDRFSRTLIKQYGIEYDTFTNDIIAAIKLYNKIEKRGFYINVKGEVYDGWQNVTINQTTVIVKSYEIYSEDTTEKLNH